jgi:hypothetical protein
MQWFLGKFKLKATIDLMEQITETIRHALSSRYQIPFSRRKVENILCKVYQTRSGSLSGKNFCDLIFPGQMLFTCEGDILRESFPSNEAAEDSLVDLYLVQRWGFHNSMLTVDEIIGKLAYRIGESQQGKRPTIGRFPTLSCLEEPRRHLITILATVFQLPVPDFFARPC